MEDVILVPGHQRMALLAADQRDNLRVQGDDGSTWVKPIEDQVRMLSQFLAKSSDVRHFRPCTGTRIGYDGTGVFIHQDHMKRYLALFGRLQASQLDLNALFLCPGCKVVAELVVVVQVSG